MTWQEEYEAALELALTDADGAARLFLSACDAASHSGDALAAAQLARSAMLLLARRDVAAASAAARRAIAELSRVTDESVWLAEASALEIAMSATGTTTEAIELARHITVVTGALPRSPSADAAHAQAQANLASALIKAGQHHEALELLGRALHRAPDESLSLIANIEYSIGLAHAELNEIREARDAYARSRAAFVSAGSDPADLAYVDRLDAAALARAGRYEEALAEFENAHRVFNDLGLSEDVDRTAVGLVQARSKLGGRFSDSDLDEYESAALRFTPSESVAMGLNLANIAHNRGDDARADRLYATFAERARAMNMPVDAARFDSSYAVVLRARGDLDAALTTNRAAESVFAAAGMLREVAQTDNNHALILEEQARELDGVDARQAAALRKAAADSAVAAIDTLDALRHSMPDAADRRALLLHAYPEVFTVAVAACWRARRFDHVAALIEKSRVQPVLRSDARGYLEPAPIATRPGAPAVGGTGTPVCLAELAVSDHGAGAAWIGWWLHDGRLVRSRSRMSDVDVESGPLAADALNLLAAALPVNLPADLVAAHGNRALAQRVAVWRAARAPLLADPELAERVGSTLLRSVRDAVVADDVVVAASAMSCDELLWPLSSMLFAESWCRDLTMAAARGERQGIVVAPPPELGRVPWAALPITDPTTGTAVRLIEVADVTVGLPASLAAGLHQRPRAAGEPIGEGVVVADSLNNLPFAQRLAPDGMLVLGPGGSSSATRTELLAALAAGHRLLVVNGHVRPGSDSEPASSALMLAAPNGRVDPMTVTEFAAVGVPAQCVILGCDGAGAATGTEWTGLATGLVWAGASEVVTTSVPVIEDALSAELDDELIASIRVHGAVDGLLGWQRNLAARARSDPTDRTTAACRWATTVALRSGARPDR